MSQDVNSPASRGVTFDKLRDVYYEQARGLVGDVRAFASTGKRPAPEKWSAGEILAHLADSEIVVGWRLRQILGAPGTPIQAYDQDSWAAAGHYGKRDPRKSAEQFRVVREANLGLLKSLAPEQWKHHGMHAERGEETVERIVHMMAGHDINHTKQVERILGTKKSQKLTVES